MLRRAWKPILGAAALVAPPAYIYYRYRNPTFSVNVKEKGPDGKVHMVKRSFPLLPLLSVDQRINASTLSVSQPPSEGLVWKHTTAHVASNDPIEDTHAQAVITTEPTSSVPARNLLVYSVMDGHSGFHTSRLLSHVLIPAVILELSSLARHEDDSTLDSAKAPSSTLDIVHSSPRALSHTDAPQDGHIERVSQAIRTAFDNVDFEIIHGPLRVLAANVTKLDTENVPDLSEHPMAEASMQPALSGTHGH